MVKELQEAKGAYSNPEVEALVGRIVSSFESGMNNDLDMKTAFDSLYETICVLHEIRWSLSVDAVKNILSHLRRIDSVFQCVF